MATGLHKGQLDVIIGSSIALTGLVGVGLALLLPEGQATWAGALVAGGVLVFGLVAAGLGAVTWHGHRAAARKLKGYRCGRCDYQPDPEKVATERPVPCPRCSEPIYVED